MKRVLVAVVASLLLLSGCSSSDGEVVSTVAPDEFVTAMVEPGTVVIDVRTPAEYAAGHVGGSVNIDVQDPDFATQVAALPKDTTYAVYCRSGNRSSVATSTMAAQGFTSLLNLDGGLVDLQAAGAPVVTG